MTRLSPRTLNRTLLARQHLLARTPGDVAGMVGHLVGLQAQETLPPYLSLAARLDDLDPTVVSRGLEDRTLVRLLTLRGTIHLLTADDALVLRQWTQPVNDRERRSSQTVREAAHLDPAEVDAAVVEALAARFPGVPPTALAGLARVQQPLAQLPPRGCWKQSGGVVYQRVDDWTGRPLAEPDPAALVRRYLAAFGPASAADVTAWSGRTGLAALVKGLDDLVRHEDEAGRPLYDVPGGEVVDAGTPAPVRLLGTYDNLWLSHAGRDRVTTPDKRKRWMGTNGGLASTIFVDGMLEGLWRVVEGRPVVVELFRDLTRTEQRDLDDELSRVEALLSR